MRRVQSRKLSDDIMDQLESMMLDGRLSSGQKLPPERTLAEQFEVSRPSVREAIQKLEAKGLVIRKQGGGTFVCNNVFGGLSDPLFDLMSKNADSKFDLLEFRLGIEGMAAYYAAMRGTPGELKDIQATFDAVSLAQIENNFRLEAEAVFEFLLSICRASHNAVILHLVTSMASLFTNTLEQNITVLARRPEMFDKMRDYRKKLLQAILAGKPQKAWSESHNHLTFIEEELLLLSQEQSFMQRSITRMQRHQ
ncbi:pyruvate dehydrogenase complex transcriptional repressor PdhR [Paraglaciecola aquimarina]|uniref:Pyruvate dehydrogenase complex repressor n=1 Tax=Paraglaciecola aquimarina TaxID=1235557 RepID=A0ABU3SWA6_9ALTE|nr:pyruvate dehydrogenase complex transcriptional repressor PdhR [Paraglaciecola aquimarina]MDU0354298.1 pyruvate dehydrogenase complex transcriptional repressor PdhR [Paraglaciecola aquimarina]